MIKKIALATLGGTVVGSLVGGLIFAGLFGQKMEQWMQENAGCLKEMNAMGAIIPSVVISLFVSILLYQMGINNFKRGAIAGAWITFFTVLWFGLWTAATFTAYTWDWLPLDVLGNTATGAIAGGAIGWILGKA
ncbi:MAG: hypothetical protein H6555_05340 [Lewinellaceae bacterium]|nr:hypothetical protein [Lewinellaceae bacterium]